jgi:hypothetical protein
MDLQELKKRKEDQMQALNKSCGLFWAFNDKQLAEGIAKNPLSEGDKYVRLKFGGFIPKSKVQAFIDGLDAINAEYKKDLKRNRLKKTNIAYELNNHEAYYTGCVESTLAALGEGYSRREVLEVYNQERRKANVNH